jgi:ribonuclease BN (tRNA processing enzyme)
LISVTAQENCHYKTDPTADAKRANKDRSYALRIQTPDKTIVFSGDTGQCPALTAFAKDADLLVHEVIDLPLTREMMRRQHVPDAVADGMMRHMTEEHTVPEDIGLLAKAAGVKKVILTHLVPGGDEPDTRYTDGVRKHFSGPVEVARDLMVFE